MVDHITSNSCRALALDVYCLLVRRGRGGRSYRMMWCFWVSSLSWESGFYSLFPIPIYDIFSHSYITYSLITDQASVFIFIYPSASRPNKVLWGYIQCILYTYAAFYVNIHSHGLDWTHSQGWTIESWHFDWNCNCVFYQKPLLWSGRTTHLSLNIKARTFKGRLQYITNIHPRRCNISFVRFSPLW